MNTKLTGPLTLLTHPQLLNRFDDLVRRDRRCTAEMLGVIAEIDDRKLWAAQACPSMFAFCMEHFHMSEAVTAKRIWAARTARRFPVIFEMVARGELHLSGIQQLAKHLTNENHQDLLDRAKHKSSRQIELLVAEVAPKPDVPSRVRALPRQREEETQTLSRGEPKHEPAAIGDESPGSTISPSEGFRAEAAATTSNSPIGSSSRGTTKPIVALSPRRYKIEITVDQETHDRLRMLEDLLGQQLSNGDPALIVSRALELLLTETLKKKAALTDRPRARAESNERDRPNRTRAIPAAIRRNVWLRDKGCCAFVDERGVRCRATRAVEFHHIQPFGKGGTHQADNIALRCRAHNQYQADLDFGTLVMNRKRQGNMPRGMFGSGQARSAENVQRLDNGRRLGARHECENFGEDSHR
jgi:hypothetical protein